MARRNFGLDVLRAVAILVVLANHAYIFFFVKTGRATWGGPDTAVSIASVISIEWLFVLSGFLIGAMMVRAFEQAGTWWSRARSFWLRRWFRTLPNYYLFLGINALLVAVGLPEGRFAWRYVVFAQNLVWWNDFTFFYAEAWSLAVDEWFYLAMPVLVGFVLLWRRAGVRAGFVAATVALIVLPTVLRLLADPPRVTAEADMLEDWDVRFRRGVVFHLDATGWGVLGAVTSRWWPRFWQARLGGKAAAGLLLMAFGVLATEQWYWGGALTQWPRLNNAAGLAAMGLGTFLALPWIATLPRLAGRTALAIDRLSMYSYSIYLVHVPLQFVLVAIVDPATRSPATLAALVAAWLALVGLLAAGLHHGFEKPVADLRERFTRKVEAGPFAPAQQQGDV